MSTPARTNPAAVMAILGPNYDRKKMTDLIPFIASASEVVDQVKTMSAMKARVRARGGLTLGTLANIEMWLSAYFYCIQDPLYMSRSTEGGSGSFQRGAPGIGFALNDYGKTAMELDWSGTLKNLGANQYAGGFGMGHHPCQAPAKDPCCDDGT